MKEHMKIRKADLVEVLRILETVVVSFDRIGSYHDDCDRRTYERLLVEFVENWAVCPYLALARRILSEYFDGHTLDDDGLDELERLMQDVSYWDADQRLPPIKPNVDKLLRRDRLLRS